MRVMALGTSSGRPTATRNVSAVAIDLGRRWVLVDAGEGTQHQIARFGLKPSRLAAVFITHLHGDHVLGLPGLLASLDMDGRTDPIRVVGPVGLARWLEVTGEVLNLEPSYGLTVVEQPDSATPGEAGPLRDVGEVEGFRVKSLPLRHRLPAHGYRFTEPDHPGRFDVAMAERLGVVEGPDFGRLQAGDEVRVGDTVVRPDQVLGPPRAGQVVVVCTDTVPCAAGVELARGASLLVHEATYLDHERDMAELWLHSTAAGAARVAAEAGVGRLLLTHFSSRYVDDRGHLAEARAVFPASDVAQEGEWLEVP